MSGFRKNGIELERQTSQPSNSDANHDIFYTDERGNIVRVDSDNKKHLVNRDPVRYFRYFNDLNYTGATLTSTTTIDCQIHFTSVSTGAYLGATSQTSGSDLFGGVALRCSATNNSQATLNGSSRASVNPLDRWAVEIGFSTSSTLSDGTDSYQIFVGNGTASSFRDGLTYTHSLSGGNFVINYNNGNSSIDTGIAVQASKYYRYRHVYVPGGNCRVYLADNTGIIYSNESLTYTTGSDWFDYCATIKRTATGTTTSSFDVDYILAEYDINTGSARSIKLPY